MPVKKPAPDYSHREEKTILTWAAPARQYKKRSRDYFTTIAAIIFLISIILIFFKEWFLIISIWAFGFFAYVLATVKPPETQHQVTTFGIRTNNKIFRWPELINFWFSTKWNQTILHINTVHFFPGQLLLILPKELTQEKLKNILLKYLVHEKPEPTWVDKASDWLQAKIPLEQ